MKNLLEIIMLASLTVVAGAIAVCLFTLGEQLTGAKVFGQVEPGVCGNDAVEMTSVADSASVDDLVLPQEQSAAVSAGEALFKGNCAQCHALNEVVVGPALAGIRKRRPEAWIRAWVKNSSKLVARGDEYAVKIYNQYQQQQMPSFQLSDQEISQILDYVEASSQATAYTVVQP